MKITIHLPDRLTERIANSGQDLPGIVVSSLLVSAFRERLINFEELWEMLALESAAEKRLFLQREQVLHQGGLLNLYGTCADLAIAADEAGIDPTLDDELEGVFDE